MSKRDKLRQRIERSPNNVAFHDLRNLLELYGFELKRTRGSHHSFAREVGGRKVLLVVPYRKPLKPVYVRHALELILEIEAEAKKEDSEEQNDNG